MQSASTKIEIDGEFHSVDSLIRERSNNWLVCLHGLQSNKRLFERLFADSRFERFSIMAPDFLGFGDSAKPESNSYELHTQYELVKSILRYREISGFHLIGHSLGGMIGTRFLKESEFHLKSFTSLEGNLLLEDCGKSREIAEVSDHEFRDSVYPQLLADLKSSTEASANLRAEAVEAIPHFVFLKTARAIVAESKSQVLLDSFLAGKVPRLLIVGQNGTFSTRPASPNIETVEIPNSGHFMLLDNPEATLSVISKFIDRVSDLDG